MLHIVNGESTLTLLHKAPSVTGDFLSWGDLLMEGPVINGLTGASDWALRAEGLERRFGIDRTEYLRVMGGCLAALDDLERHGEAVLWFEDCWFCQIHLVYLLARLRGSDGAARVALICPETALLGELSPERLAERFAERRPVSPERMDLAAAVWEAYSAPEPLPLARLLGADFRAWPALRQGVLSHLRRFPSPRNGLNVVEEEVLRAVAEGDAEFAAVFRRWSAAADGRALGAGDLQFGTYLEELAAGPDPLLAIEKRGGLPHWRLALTGAGRAALRSERIWKAGQAPDRWLGGVRLAADPGRWRWDGERGRFA